jgi:hypothetical protein
MARHSPRLRLAGCGIDRHWRFRAHKARTLTDYVGLDGYRNGGGRGRAYTTGFGIIGLAWRLGAERVEAQVNPDPSQLVERWGMTLKEAQSAGSERQAFSAVTLRCGNQVVGLFYADAYQPGTFGSHETQEDLAEAVRRGAARTALDVQLSKLYRRFERRGPRMKPFDR